MITDHQLSSWNDIWQSSFSDFISMLYFSQSKMVLYQQWSVMILGDVIGRLSLINCIVLGDHCHLQYLTMIILIHLLFQIKCDSGACYCQWSLMITKGRLLLRRKCDKCDDHWWSLMITDGMTDRLSLRHLYYCSTSTGEPPQVIPWKGRQWSLMITNGMTVTLYLGGLHDCNTSSAVLPYKS